MNLWICVTVILYLVQQSESAWDESKGLILNKTGDTYNFPRYVSQAEQGPYIQYKEPTDTNTQTYVFCSTKTKNDDYILTGQLLKQDATSFSCPERDSPIQPIQETIEEEGASIPCGTAEEKNGLKHQVYYELYETGPDGKIIESKPYRMVLYTYCFHEKMKEILYAEFSIDNPQLLQNKLLQLERTSTFPLIAIDDSTAIEEYKQNNYNLPRMVGIPEFMPFALAKKPFYLYDSSAPLNKELDDFWEEFLSNISENISKKTEPIKVISGIYDRKRVHGLSQYLSRDTVVRPSPYAYWVLLYNQDISQGVSLIMHNYAFDRFEHRHKLLCDRSICAETGFQNSLPDPMKYKHVMAYCCPASTITKLYDF